jgi:hypothetical protein
LSEKFVITILSVKNRSRDFIFVVSQKVYPLARILHWGITLSDEVCRTFQLFVYTILVVNQYFTVKFAN